MKKQILFLGLIAMMIVSCSLINAGGPADDQARLAEDRREIFEHNRDIIDKAYNDVDNIVKTSGKYNFRSRTGQQNYPRLDWNLNKYAQAHYTGAMKKLDTYLDKVFAAIKDAYKAIANDPISKQSSGQPAVTDAKSTFMENIRRRLDNPFPTTNK